jgi:hypothetical protein
MGIVSLSARSERFGAVRIEFKDPGHNLSQFESGVVSKYTKSGFIYVMLLHKWWIDQPYKSGKRP